MTSRERDEVIDVGEACYCGRTDALEGREPVLDASNRWALRCPECGHLDHLPWLSEEAALLLWGEAKHRRDMRHGHVAQQGQ